MKEYELSELENGIRLIHKQTNFTKIAHVGLMLDIGSRDEQPEEQGIAHFWEHMAFKGTEKRSSYHIINRLENLGGELNAYTTKEKICFFASVLDEHLDKAVDLLIDIAFHATFPDKQIEREKMVILEEMAMYKDTPEDAIQDDLEELVFANHPIGANIIGTETTVSSFQRDSFLKFIQRNLNTTKIVISSVGSYNFQKVERIVKKYLTGIPYKNHTQQRIPFAGYRPVQVTQLKPIIQSHMALGMPAFELKDPRRLPFYMLTNILGGPAMNSRLNMSLREKHGLVYSVDLSYSSMSDTGLLAIFLATDPKNLKKSESLIEKEIQALKKAPLSVAQLSKAKAQLKGQLAMSEENHNAMMLMMAKSMLDLNKIPDLNSIFDKIDQVSAAELQALAIEGLDMSKMSKLTFLPDGSQQNSQKN